jgi:hypothetical protein
VEAAWKQQGDDYLMEQLTNSVELRIWREEGGTWRCRVLTPSGFHSVRLDDQAALNAYISSQIDMFIKAYELQEQTAHN